MQAVKVSSLGQTFALAKISNSRERKPRSRKTREERKAMVESFVKKYQNSNNGSFPSLNLTHKEVGGSFYTIRELVREIIQENRVLGPGSPTSKVLNLESSSEDDEVQPFSTDLPSDMSTSTIGHAINQKQKQLLEEHHANMDVHLDIPKSEPQERFASHKDISFQKQKQLLEEHHASLDVNLDIPKSEPQERFASHKDISFQKQKELLEEHHASMDVNLDIPKSEPQERFTSHKDISFQKQKQLLEEHHASMDVNLDIPKSEPQERFSSHNDISFSEDRTKGTSIRVENTFTATYLNGIVADDIAGSGNPSVQTQDILSNSENLNAKQPAPSSVSAMSSAGAFLVNGSNGTNESAKAPGTFLENDVPGIDSLPENKIPEDSLPESKVATSSSTRSASDKLLDPSVPFAVEVFPIPSSAKTYNPNKSFLEQEGAKEEAVSPTNVKDPAINEVSAIPMSLESEFFEPSASRTINIKMESGVTVDPSSSGEPISPQVDHAPQSQDKVGREVQGYNTSYSSSKSTEKDIRDSKPSEINPLWSAIRAFVTAVFKFWT